MEAFVSIQLMAATNRAANRIGRNIVKDNSRNLLVRCRIKIFTRRSRFAKTNIHRPMKRRRMSVKTCHEINGTEGGRRWTSRIGVRIQFNCCPHLFTRARPTGKLRVLCALCVRFKIRQAREFPRRVGQRGAVARRHPRLQRRAHRERRRRVRGRGHGGR